jgi:hypothetical protein
MPISIVDGMLRDVKNELARAEAKFPKFNSHHEGYAVLLEEVDELWEEIKKKKDDRDKNKMIVEAIQIAAMALRFIKDT